MKIGLHFINFTLPGGPQAIGPALVETAKIAEEAGCAKFTLMDHYFQMEMFATAQDPMLEGYTALGFLAGQTSKMKLGLLVTGVTYRHPGLLAKIVTTLDVLSQGRAELGLGAAWYEREHHGLGVPYPSTAERFERLEETLQICLQMWSDNDGPFLGAHYRLAETICQPKPVSQPRPSIVIGGGGEKKTLRLVAKYADGTNLFAESPEVVRHKLDVLKRHCDTEGRDYDRIEKSIVGSTVDTRDQDKFVALMAQYAAEGIELVEVTARGDDPAAWTAEFMTRVAPRLADL